MRLTPRFMMSSTQKLILYHSPGSFYSQKVRVVLCEKGLDYEKRLVNTAKNENCEPWFMKLNPKGQIPTLLHEQNVISDSKNIMAYLDHTFPETQQLYPDESSTEGQQVAHWQGELDRVNNFLLKHGTNLHPDMVEVEPKGAQAARDEIFNMRRVKLLEELAAANPDLAEVYRQKIPVTQTQYERAASRQTLIEELDKVGTILDQVEQDLKNKDSDFFLGSSLTAADVCLFVLLHRLVALGYTKRFFGDDKRLHCLKYYKKMATRSSFKQECVDI